jgi:alpha-glucosidase
MFSKLQRLMVALVLLGFAGAGLAFASTQQRPVVVTSPDGKLRAELTVDGGALRYRILLDGKQILSPSGLGIRTDGIELGQNVDLGTAKFKLVHESYRFFGAHALAVNNAREASIPATSANESFSIDVHVANDGVALRLRLPAKKGRKIEADRSTWALEGNPTLWADSLTSYYESPYRTVALKDLDNGLYGMPLTARVDGVYLTMTEAALKDYGDLALRRKADGVLEGELYADPQGWTTDDAVIQPWRVTVVARTLSDLVNTTLVQNLNPAPDAKLAAADWIRPGRSTWQWMAIGAPQLDDQKQWVDWTQKLGYEYYLVDEGWADWKDAWNNLAAVSAYAKSHNVKVWLWVHSNEVKDAEARRAYFRKAVEAGVVGVKIDFPPACNRWWSNWYYDTARDAADFKLLVDFHGANKPTGFERTWPNVLTREGVRGHEYHITRYGRLQEPAHDTILPFTRYIAGPGDYTPTVFEAKELQGNSWAHEAAQSIVFTSPFLCFGGHPKDFIANPAFDVLREIPAVWDETRVLPGSEPGKIVAEARRHGIEWFVAVLNGSESSEIDLPLNFLGTGHWISSQFYDVQDKLDAYARKDVPVSAQTSIHLKLAPRGGFIARLHP